MSNGASITNKWVHKTLSKSYKRWRYYFVIDDSGYLSSEITS
jgi:hypothetical protein